MRCYNCGSTNILQYGFVRLCLDCRFLLNPSDIEPTVMSEKQFSLALQTWKNRIENQIKELTEDYNNKLTSFQNEINAINQALKKGKKE